jgi:PKD repeat protein
MGTFIVGSESPPDGSTVYDGTIVSGRTNSGEAVYVFACSTYHNDASCAWMNVPAFFASGGSTTVSHNAAADGGMIAMKGADDLNTVIHYHYNADPAPPVASFSGTPLSIQAPGYVQFTDTSTFTTSWLWNFGAGSGIPDSVQQHPLVKFTDIGDWTVTLTATGVGGSDAEVKTNYVHVTSYAPAGSPVAEFTTDHTDPVIPETVQFTDASTGNPPTSWYWDFGNGVTSTAQNPEYEYPVIGTYSVALQAINANGSSTIVKTDYITVTGGVSFTATPRTGDVSVLVTFTDTTTGGPATWDWDWGDGTAHGNTQNPTHTYTAGTYSVTLTVTY